MKTSERFTNAVTKLYNAFHENRLYGLDACACAVGNICNNKEDWQSVISFGEVEETPNKEGLRLIKETGYSVSEIAEIEIRFLYQVPVSEYKRGKFKYQRGHQWFRLKENQFKGLCAVVEYLCELEGIPNVMDYTSLFETEADRPKHKLEEVFA